jgi:hypothetical protein
MYAASQLIPQGDVEGIFPTPYMWAILPCCWLHCSPG